MSSRWIEKSGERREWRGNIEVGWVWYCCICSIAWVDTVIAGVSRLRRWITVIGDLLIAGVGRYPIDLHHIIITGTALSRIRATWSPFHLRLARSNIHHSPSCKTLARRQPGKYCQPQHQNRLIPTTNPAPLSLSSPWARPNFTPQAYIENQRVS